MAVKESESEGETIETGWSVSTSRVLIQFYSENPLLWDKNHKEYWKKNIITKTLKPLLAMLGESRAPNTEEAVKKRWHGLRSTTIRNFKKTVECKWVFNSITKNKITRLLRKSAILFSGYQAYAVRLLSADPTIWSPGVYRTCQQSRGLVPSPVHTKG